MNPDTRITITVPSWLVNELFVLSERTGEGVSAAAADALERFLADWGEPIGWHDPADWLDRLFAASHAPGAWERLRLRLPAHHVAAIALLADVDHTSLGKVFTAMVATGVRGRLAQVLALPAELRPA